MTAVKDPVTGLTSKQEHFAQLVAYGLNQSDAYRQAYDVSPSSPSSTVNDQGYTLAHHAYIAPRIAELRAKVAAKRSWNRERMVEQAEKHINVALEGGYKGVSAANGALELIGKVTGLLTDTRVDLNVSGTITHALASLTDEELRALVAAARLATLGQLPEAPGQVVEGQIVMDAPPDIGPAPSG